MVDLAIVLALVIVGYIFGQRAERRHFQSIIAREEQYQSLLCFSERFPPTESPPPDVELVAGNVVVSIDYFKRIVAGLRMLFGGRVTAYESLLERARREAVLRMKEDAMEKGAHSVFNVKLETASITKGRGRQVGAVEVYAYGTALINKPGS